MRDLHDSFESLLKDKISHSKKIPSSKELNEIVSQVVENVVPEASKSIAQHLTRSAPKMVEERRLLQQEFESRLHRRWLEAFYGLHSLIEISVEVAPDSIPGYSGPESLLNAPRNYAILKLHARSCQVCYEILNLLRAGYADAAFARWRTLHELHIIFEVIAKNGDDLARRYLDHEAVDNHRLIKVYQKTCSELGQDPFSSEEVKEIDKRYTLSIRTYGREYKSQYGWASILFSEQGKDKQRKIKFEDLERLADLGKLHSYYTWACQQVHAGSVGNRIRIGLQRGYEDMLHYGASNYGLSIPGQSTAISITQLTIRLLLLTPTIDKLIASKSMLILQEKTCATFAHIDKVLEEENLHTDL